MSAVLQKRITFGLTMAAAVLGLLWLDAHTGRSFGFAALAAVALPWGTRELHRMLETIAPVPWRRPSEAAAVALVLAYLLENEGFLGRLRVADLVVPAFTALFLASQLWYEPSRERVTSIALTLTSIFYILVLGMYALKCRYLPEIGPAALFYLLFIAKGTDVFAFFTGRAFGKRKLIPWISPGKTVAGLVGGLLGAVFITGMFVRHSSLGSVVGWSAAVPFGIIMGLSSVAGDLVESLIKRGAAVKDSGGLVPEFGGVLDIVDSVLFCAPVLYVGIALLGQR